MNINVVLTMYDDCASLFVLPDASTMYSVCTCGNFGSNMIGTLNTTAMRMLSPSVYSPSGVGDVTCTTVGLDGTPYVMPTDVTDTDDKAIPLSDTMSTGMLRDTFCSDVGL